MDKYVEALNGFMDVLGTMNMDSNRISDYTIIKLSDDHNLMRSINTYHQSLTDKYPPGYWHPKLDIVQYETVNNIASRWFFEGREMQMLPQKIQNNVLAAFHDRIIECMGNFEVYKLDIAPPIWYASTWDEFIFDSQHGRYLLHFSCYD